MDLMIFLSFEGMCRLCRQSGAPSEQLWARRPTPSYGRRLVGEHVTRRGFAWHPLALYGQFRYLFSASTRGAFRLS